LTSYALVQYTFKDLGIIFEIPYLQLIVLEALCKIPPGKVTTYKDISTALGDGIASRAVGYIMKTNPLPDRYPCYKVLGSDGSLKGYSLGIEKKLSLLEMEGIEVRHQRITNVGKYLVDPSELQIPPVLSSMKGVQELLANKVSLTTERRDIRFVVTFDLSFLDGPPDIGIGVGCAFDLTDKKLLGVGISFVPTFIPYIPTYLAFRELPAVLVCLSAIKKHIPRIDALILDGQGILHPRGFGIASHVGVLTNIPSIGVAKSLLVGKILDTWIHKGKIRYTPIIHADKIAGFLVVQGRNKIIVSPGHKFSPEDALEFVTRLDWPNNESEPLIIRLPHRIASRLRDYARKSAEQFKNDAKKQRSLQDFLINA